MRQERNINPTRAQQKCVEQVPENKSGEDKSTTNAGAPERMNKGEYRYA